VATPGGRPLWAALLGAALLWIAVAVVAIPIPALAQATVVGGGGWAHAGVLPGAVAPPLAVPAATPAGYPVAGIDVSSNDHSGGRTIDWAGQANAGVRFAYVKATEGSTYVNPYFDSDYHTAKNQGLYVGAYHFARPDNGNPVGQADFLINNAQWTVDGVTLVPFLDIEWPYASLGLPDCWGLSPAQMSAWIGAFVNEVQVRIGRPPMIYTNSNWWNPCTAKDASFANLPLDIAGYTTSPPPLPAGWNRFTIWQYADGPWPGDKDVFNGSLAELAAFAGANTAPQTPAFESVLARDPQGRLLVYPNVHGRGESTLSAPFTAGLGWNGLSPIDAGDVNGDGRDDVLTRDGLGVLRVYPDRQGTGTALFAPPSTVGLGWNGMNIIELGDVTRDHRVDIVARDGGGNLWLYPSSGLTGVNTWAGPTRLGMGWNVMSTIKLGDLNSDGRTDLVARDGSGNLWLYPGTGGTGTATFGSPIQLGIGWNGMNAIALGDMNGDGRCDLMARDGGGILWLYPNAAGSGIHTLAGPSELGFGWGAMTALDLGTF
jgi:GH25 family lysozyme M1 (1,4-beta-N-acetylmuramidase)